MRFEVLHRLEGARAFFLHRKNLLLSVVGTLSRTCVFSQEGLILTSERSEFALLVSMALLQIQ